MDRRCGLSFEGLLFTEAGGCEGDFLRRLAFVPLARGWMGESVKCCLPPGAPAMGDVNFIDDARAGDWA
ncbi:MAG: hypothetical protein AAF281_01095 [Pseudomonadota bacterium]